MKTLKTLLIAGALVFATSAATAQSSFELSKHEMGTKHLEAKFVESEKTVTQNYNANDRDRIQRANQPTQKEDQGVADEFSVMPGFEYAWTILLDLLY